MILYPDQSACCNCNACTQICPKDAIFLKEDRDGFVFPHIDQDKCIDCGLCQKVCSYQHIEETNNVKAVYAAKSNDTAQMLHSASGGIFAAVASIFIKQGAIVYGAAISRRDGEFVISHRGVTSMDELVALQGSKYVQSAIGDCFKEIRAHLIGGRTVLFCGTPCQCAGLKGFLRKDYPNLYIIDVICHGVPNQRMFNDYVNYQFGDLPGITSFAFRDKSRGWELSAKITYDGGRKHRFIPAGTSSFYSLFLSAQNYRINCHSCKYASDHRPGDITIGDYWGIQKQHPELLKNGTFSAKNGISCIIVNSERGAKMLAELGDSLTVVASTYDKVAAKNAQLVQPMKEGKYRKDVMRIYEKDGFEGLTKFYKQKYRKTIIIHSILTRLPFWLKNFLRSLPH